MKLLIIFECEFGNRESFESLFEVITNEGIGKGIITNAETIRNQMPITIETVTRRIQFVENHPNIDVRSED